MNNVALQQSLQLMGVTVRQDWLEAYLEAYSRERSQGISMPALQTYLLQQTLVSDLAHVVSTGRLPANLHTTATTSNIRGPIMLQVLDWYDVGSSLYSQLEGNQDMWVAKKDDGEETTKPSRMLRLVLSDGVQEVIGMEYRRLSFMVDSLPLGFKVIVELIHFYPALVENSKIIADIPLLNIRFFFVC